MQPLNREKKTYKKKNKDIIASFVMFLVLTHIKFDEEKILLLHFVHINSHLVFFLFYSFDVVAITHANRMSWNIL